MVSNRDARAMGYKNKYEYKYGPPRKVGAGEAVIVFIILAVIFIFL